jgi:transcriptional regulator with AAA-type ATPase domain
MVGQSLSERRDAASASSAARADLLHWIALVGVSAELAESVRGVAAQHGMRARALSFAALMEARALGPLPGDLAPSASLIDLTAPEARSHGLALANGLRRLAASPSALIAPADLPGRLAFELGRIPAIEWIPASPGASDSRDLCLTWLAAVIKRRQLLDCEWVGESQAMRALHEALSAAATSPSHVLLRGETGVGKGLLARRLHALSPRAREPFAVLDCAGLPESLAEGELFGCERGAYTGANASRPGRVEAAGAGTLFLDEIGELALPVQARFLRLLEDGEYQRLGSLQVRRLQARVIAASHRDLRSDVECGRFRRDLYHRLRVIEIEIPPLRERRSDLAALARVLLGRLAARMGGPPPDVTDELAAALASYRWPGNVRELRHVLEAAWLRSRGAPLEVRHLAGLIEREPDLAPAPVATADCDAERRAIERALRGSAGNVSRAARELGLSRSQLRRRLEALARAERARGGFD